MRFSSQSYRPELDVTEECTDEQVELIGVGLVRITLGFVVYLSGIIQQFL